jgi:PRC-barrel domain
MPRPLIETTRGWRDKTMVDREGAPLGHITHIYLEEVTGEPEWALVATGEDRRVFVPLVDATEQQDQVRVPVERALVSDAPAIRPGRRLPKEDTARLHGYYGGAPELRWGSARRMPSGGPAARLRQGLDWARERVPGPAAVGSRRTRRLLAAGQLPHRWPAACWWPGAVGESGHPAWPALLVGPSDRCLRCPPGRCVGGGCMPWLGRRPRPSPRPGGPWPGPAAAGRHRPERRNRERRGIGGHAWQAT